MLTRSTARAPSRTHLGDAGLDLYAAEDVRLPSGGGRAAVVTGVTVALPRGYVGLVCPRSGLAVRHGITVLNAPGVVDAGYRGEIAVILVNTDPELAYQVAQGDRVAQLVVVPVADLVPVAVSALDQTTRSEAGLGSSGR